MNDKAYQSLRHELEKDYAKGQDNYPNTIAGATALMNRYRVQTQRQQPKSDHNKQSDESVNINVHNSETTPAEDTDTTEETNINSEEDESDPEVDEEIAIAHNMMMRNIDYESSDDKDDSDREFVLFARSPQDNQPIELYRQFGKIEVPQYIDHSDDDAREMFGIDTRHDEHTNQDSQHTFDETRMYQFTQMNGGSVDPNWLLLDSQASCNIICNQALVNNIQKHPEGRSIRVHCNSGSIILDTVADMRGYGRVWFYKDGIANCFCPWQRCRMRSELLWILAKIRRSIYTDRMVPAADSYGQHVICMRAT